MARSSKAEPVEKFRFKVTFFDLTAFNFAGNTQFKNDSDKNLTAGFTQIDLPKATINTIEYRENNDMNRTTKQAGLVSYEPVTLRKGVTSNRGLYSWYKDVHNDIYDLDTSNELAAAVNWVPVHKPNYRKEVIISSLDRESNGVRHWLLVNCFPIAYKGGNDLDSGAEDKLIEELTLTYEAFVELNGADLFAALSDAQTQAIEAFQDAASAVAIGAVAGAIGSVFK